MISLTQEEWNMPVTEAIPVLGGYVRAHRSNASAIYSTAWEKITPWALATQLSGIAALGLFGNIATSYAQSSGEAYMPPNYGLPPVNVTVLGPCVTKLLTGSTDIYCPAPDGVEGDEDLQPNFLPWTNPSYSDENFMLLGTAISNITGKQMSALYQESVFKPLNMTSSADMHPAGGSDLARSVVAGSDFFLEIGFTTPSGGILSTLNDLSKLGVGIMNSTLLPIETTRKWMKPVTHTASLSYSIGGPWEIHRYVHPSTGRVTDLDTKLGDSGSYGAAIVLIPQYDAGLAMLNAYNESGVRSLGALIILDYINNTIIPAHEAQAASEALSNFAGTYVATNETLNASVRIKFNASEVPYSQTGLSVASWIFNDTDVLAGPLFGDSRPRLEPSILKQTPVGHLARLPSWHPSSHKLPRTPKPWRFQIWT